MPGTDRSVGNHRLQAATPFDSSAAAISSTLSEKVAEGNGLVLELGALGQSLPLSGAIAAAARQSLNGLVLGFRPEQVSLAFSHQTASQPFPRGLGLNRKTFACMRRLERSARAYMSLRRRAW